MLLSTNFGQTWECLTEFVYGNPAATAIGFHPARPYIIYNSGEGLICEGHIKISYDSGQSWNDHGNSLGLPGDNCVHQPTFHPIDPDHWLAGGEGCVFLSDDSGMRVGSATTDADGRAEINTASLTKGVYIVTVMQHDSVVYTRKIAKQ